MTSGPSACSLNSNEVTMPKLPPPPRSAQKRSGFSLALARTSSPSAVTTCAAMRLSTVRPNLRVVQPKPPPSARPATPVVELMPSGVASAEGLRFLVEIGEQSAGLDARGAGLRIDLHRFHQRQIDEQPAIADRVARDVVAAAAHRKQQAFRAGEFAPPA